MDGKTKMAFRFEAGLPLVTQIEDCAVKAFIDEFGVLPNICEVPEGFLGELPSHVGKMDIRGFRLRRVDPPNEYWVGVEHGSKRS